MHKVDACIDKVWHISFNNSTARSTCSKSNNIVFTYSDDEAKDPRLKDDITQYEGRDDAASSSLNRHQTNER